MAKKARFKEMVDLFDMFITGHEEMFNALCSELGHPTVIYDNPTKKEWRCGINKRTNDFHVSFFMPIKHYGCFMGEDGEEFEPRPYIYVFNYTRSSKNPNRHILSVIGNTDDGDERSTMIFVFKNGQFKMSEVTSQDNEDLAKILVAYDHIMQK